MGSFVAVGKALLTIRDRKLYGEQYRNFKVYCANKWGMSSAHSTRLIGGSQVATNLLTSEHFTSGAKLAPYGTNFRTLVKIQPTNEYKIRPLTQLEPEQQCDVWEEAVRSADGKTVTYKQVKATVKELTAPAPEPNPPSASHSGFAYSGPSRRAPFAPPA
jgi:hypothetical protein